LTTSLRQVTQTPRVNLNDADASGIYIAYHYEISSGIDLLDAADARGLHVEREE